MISGVPHVGGLRCNFGAWYDQVKLHQLIDIILQNCTLFNTILSYFSLKMIYPLGSDLSSCALFALIPKHILNTSLNLWNETLNISNFLLDKPAVADFAHSSSSLHTAYHEPAPNSAWSLSLATLSSSSKAALWNNDSPEEATIPQVSSSLFRSSLKFCLYLFLQWLFCKSFPTYINFYSQQIQVLDFLILLMKCLLEELYTIFFVLCWKQVEVFGKTLSSSDCKFHIHFAKMPL